MARTRRIEFYGAYYHVIQRGVNREDVFRNNGDKSYLLEIVADAKAEFDFKIFAYVIMNNHYHFLIQTLNIPISKIMHYINTRYAIYYNKSYKRVGHVFENRYKGILVQNTSYFVTLIKYIHNNPVAARLCRSMEEYQWSSDFFYRMNVNTMVDIGEFLDFLSPNRIEAIEEYIRLMDEKEKLSQEELMQTYENNSIIGSEDFIRRVTLGEGERESLDEILLRICPSIEDYKLIKTGSRLRYLTKYKRDYINLARKVGYTNREIGENIGVTGQAIQSIIG